MKILFFTYDFPFPANTGGKMRAYNLIKYAKEDNEILLFSFVRRNFEYKYADELKKIGISKIKVFQRKPLKSFSSAISVFDPVNSVFKKLYYDQKINAELEKTVTEENVNLIHFESFYTSFYINQAFKKAGIKLLMGEENVEYDLYFDYAKNLSPLFLKPVYYLESRKIRNEEQQLWRKADACLAVLPEEAQLIENTSSKKCFVIPNGVDLSYFKFMDRPKCMGRMLFVGNFSYFPNISAIRHFYSNIFRKINYPDLTLTILGKDAVKLPIQDDRIRLIDYVEDIRSEYYKADCFVFPIKYGGGTNFKLLEAMACGLPIVAYPDRLNGLRVDHNKQMLIASDTKDFCFGIEKLFSDNELATTLSRNARKLVEDNYSWTVIGRKLNRIWKEL